MEFYRNENFNLVPPPLFYILQYNQEGSRVSATEPCSQHTVTPPRAAS